MKKYKSQEIKDFVSKPLFDDKVILSKDLSYPKISVITPSYNQSEFLERTILSVLNQNYPNLEYIIIDGGSTDSSVEIIKKYEKYLTYWVSEKDKGQSNAINKGLIKATGQICAYLNSDDVFLPDALNFVAKTFSERDIDLLYGHCYAIDEKDNITNLLVALPFKLIESIHGVFSIPQQSSFWKRRVWEEIGGFNEENKTCMDYEFYVRAGLKKFSFSPINKIIACFRIHKGSITGSGKLNSQYIADRERIIKEFGYNINDSTYKIKKMLYRLKYLHRKLIYRLVYL